jgi:uncharacterized membrane protein YphA (DoxX/SURF4 family)
MQASTGDAAVSLGESGSKQRIRTIAYWITTILGPASFAYGGVIHILRRDDVVANLAHLGYPAYFATILGVWKLLGAIAVVVPGWPRLKEWAYAGFFFDLTGAAASRAFVGDGVAEQGGVVAPLVFLALVMASWALRPASRRLSQLR